MVKARASSIAPTTRVVGLAELHPLASHAARRAVRLQDLDGRGEELDLDSFRHRGVDLGFPQHT